MLSNQLQRDIATMESFCHSTSAMEVFGRIKTALVELGTTPNTAKPKLPRLAEVKQAVARNLEKRYHTSFFRIVEETYEFIERQLSA